ncbi:hypothetical protein RE476_02640 [Methanolobus mangrovi]|uniref:Uncharacterized protein n=1 Tax=Methanolobus mangrovi TaxID=3072977 RepID=A0AA51UJA3_9EURY|nr:hypothetical protein [Methanolobus mangrovi]WMW22736.1 hypothetical protein RE476_02640 [Methanolobus mangrovi]
MATTFDGIPFSPRLIPEKIIDFEFNATTLLSGKVSIQASSEQRFSRTYECYTESLSEITALLAKIGIKGTLTDGLENITNCYITPPFSYKEVLWGSGKYTYTITFQRETS